MHKERFMWTIKDGRKRLDITKIRSDFKTVSQDGVHLVCPKKNVWDWEEEEKWLRSIVVDNDGFIVSCSWKKFGNYGEFTTDTSCLDKALETGRPVRFSHKEDGSLCIRSIINGKVVFRTRGTLYGGEPGEDGQASFGDRFRAIAQAKYPILLDENWMKDRSLLFEYVAPANTIVIRYKSEDLVFLGFVMHDDFQIGKWQDLVTIADEAGLNLVRLHNLPTDPVKIMEEVKTWKEEGIVARCEDVKGNLDQNFVKIKSAHYLANHRMKFSMKYPTIVEFIESANIKSEVQLIAELQACDYDWEIIESAKEFYKQYVTICQEVQEIQDDASNLTKEFFLTRLDAERADPLVRKDFATLACKQQGMVRTMMFCLYDNKLDRINNLRRKFILSGGKRR